MRPRCYNRAPFPPGFWLSNGHRGLKPVLRWVPMRFEDRCATWDTRVDGVAEVPYPVLHGFDCRGCRLYKEN